MLGKWAGDGGYKTGVELRIVSHPRGNFLVDFEGSLEKHRVVLPTDVLTAITRYETFIIVPLFISFSVNSSHQMEKYFLFKLIRKP